MKPKKKLWHKILFIISPLLIYSSVRSIVTYDFSRLSTLNLEKFLPTILPLAFSGVIAYYFSMLFYLEMKEYYNKWKQKSKEAE